MPEAIGNISEKNINSSNAIEPMTESPTVIQTAISVDSTGQGASTFLGDPLRGGWRPIFLNYPGHKPGHGIPEIIDWQCPQCDLPIYKSVSGKHKCMKCGLPVLEYPTIKLSKNDFDNRAVRKSWKTWMDNKLNPDEE